MAKAFAGKDNKAEEMKEARQVRGGKVSPAQYANKEKAEGDKKSKQALERTGKALASGKMTPKEYAAAAKMKKGGMVRGKC